MKKKKTLDELRIRNSTAEFLTFTYQAGGDGGEIRVQDGTIGLSQKNMGALFETTPDNVGLHLKNIFAAGELIAKTTTEEFSVVQTEGARQVERVIAHYNLDAIIAVGYRVNSKYRVIQDRLFRSDFDRFVELEERAADSAQGDGGNNQN